MFDGVLNIPLLYIDSCFIPYLSELKENKNMIQVQIRMNTPSNILNIQGFTETERR